MAQNYGLGRGLSSLIPQKKPTIQPVNEQITEPKEDFNYFGSQSKAKISSENNITQQKKNPEKGNILEVAVSSIAPNPYQPRLEFDKEKLQELANSIKVHGVIQPLIVTKKEADKYELIAGERRLQASKLIGLEKIPVIVREESEQNKFELAIIENIQRHDLNLIEEALSYKKLADEFGLSQEEIASKIGKSRSVVANRMRLLTLPIEIQKALNSGKITEGHCKLLLAIPNPEKQRAFYEMILKDKLTVRQTESLTGDISVRTHKRKITIDPEIKNREDEISSVLGTKVKIKKSGSGGRIVIEYYSQEELDGILGKIK